MADESKKIILQLSVDASQGIKDIVSVKDQIAKLRVEQAALDKETASGKQINEAYTAQIKALGKEQKSLELAVEKTAAGFNFEAGSIAANRAELSKLTAEYKNLAAPTQDQTNKIKALSDILKAQESAIGNDTRQVGSYKEAIAGIGSQLGPLSPAIGALTSGFGNVTKQLGNVSKSFQTLGGAIKLSGIGLLLILLGSLVSYFKSTDEGANQLSGVMNAFGIVMKKIVGVFTELGGWVINLFDGTQSLSETFSNLGDIVIENLKSRLEGLLNIFVALGDIVSELVKNGFEGDFQPAIKSLADASIQAGTGVKGATDKIAAFAQELAAAAKVAYDFAIKMDAIDDAQRALNVTNAKSNQEVQQLIISAKNRTLTEQERIDKFLLANEKEEAAVRSQLSLDKQRLALISERNKAESDAINQRLNNDIKEETNEEKKIKLQQQALNIQDKLNQEEADLQQKIIDGETNFFLLRDKNQNKIDVLNEKIAADREKAYQDYLKQLADVNAAELSLEDQRQARIIKDLQYQTSLIGKSDSDQIKNLKALNASKIEIEEAEADERIAILQKIAVEEIALEKKLANDKLAALTSEGLLEDANQQEIELKKQAIIEDAQAKKLDIERKTSDEIVAISKKTNDDIAKNDADALAKKKQGQISVLNTIGNTLNQFASEASAINQAQLETQLANNESARSKELASSAKDKDTQAKINAKYDAIAAADQKKAAKADLTIKEIQAVANGALAISQALASAPPPLDFILAAAAGAAAAVQIVDLETQKSKLAKGGIVHGPSHANGGVTGTGRFNNVEVEGGEFVINKKATKENMSLLYHINNYSKPPMATNNRLPIRRFAAGGILNDGGLSASQNAGSTNDVNQQINALQKAMKQITYVVGVKDIIAAQENKAQVVQRSKVAS